MRVTSYEVDGIRLDAVREVLPSLIGDVPSMRGIVDAFCDDNDGISAITLKRCGMPDEVSMSFFRCCGNPDSSGPICTLGDRVYDAERALDQLLGAIADAVHKGNFSPSELGGVIGRLSAVEKVCRDVGPTKATVDRAGGPSCGGCGGCHDQDKKGRGGCGGPNCGGCNREGNGVCGGGCNREGNGDCGGGVLIIGLYASR